LRKTPDGWEEIVLKPMPPTPDDFVPAYDPDNPVLTDEIAARRKRVPRTKTLRRVLQLTQEEFSERYQIPIGTLRDWEQGRTEPDAPAKGYLRAIAADPEGVAKAQTSAPRTAAE
jgi:putative transcriptional regulator